MTFAVTVLLNDCSSEGKPLCSKLATSSKSKDKKGHSLVANNLVILT